MDRLMREAKPYALARGYVDVPLLRNRYHVGIKRAESIIAEMVEDGLVEPVPDAAGHRPIVIMNPHEFIFHCCDYCKMVDCMCQIMDGATVGLSSVPPLHDGCECHATAVMR